MVGPFYTNLQFVRSLNELCFLMWFVRLQAEQIRNLIEALFIESDEVRKFMFSAHILAFVDIAELSFDFQREMHGRSPLNNF